jgi:hypothetical protein
MKALNAQLGSLVSENLNLNHFFTGTIDQYGIQFLGNYNLIVDEYLLNQGFEIYDWAYADNPARIEYKRGQVRIVLINDEK